MMKFDNPILGVPTNIITGFLGVGKTSVILNLLANKPNNERWAVLVNEFGEIGVDGRFFKNQQDGEQQVFIREVPGGCMCCAAGVPMQVALNQLLSEARPDRLLIEPTGLGHPKEVLQVLSSEHYRKVLSLQKNITLVDARQLSDARYTEHETFNQQIAIADIVVGNKLDLYQADEQQALVAYTKQVSGAETQVLFAQHGELPFNILEGDSTVHVNPPHHHHHHDHDKPLASELPLPENGILKAVNEGEGFQSIGWRFSSDKRFDRQKLLKWLSELKVERAKAAFITEQGCVGYNLTHDGLTEVDLEACMESRIELIATSIDQSFETQLLDCLR